MKNQAKRLTAVFLAFSMIVNVPGQSVWAEDMTEPTSEVEMETEICSDESPAQEDGEAIVPEAESKPKEASVQETESEPKEESVPETESGPKEESSQETESEPKEESVPETESGQKEEESPAAEESAENETGFLTVDEISVVEEEAPGDMSDEELIADSPEDFTYYVGMSDGENYLNLTGLAETKADAVSAVIPAEMEYPDYGVLPVRGISGSAFLNAENLTEVTIPATVRWINDRAFSGLSNLRKVTFAQDSELQSIDEFAFYRTGLSDIVLPENLEEIGQSAFSRSEIASVWIPASVTTIGRSAFEFCAALTTAEFEEGIALETLETSVFNETGLTSFTIPASVTSIGESALGYNADMAELIFEEGIQISEIGEGAFWSSGIERLELPASVEKIGKYAFSSCTKLREIVFPEDSRLTTIEQQAFQNDGLETLTIPKSVSFIGESAFRGLNSLRTLDFEEGSQLKELGPFAFAAFRNEGESHLETLNLPEGLEKIGQKCFVNVAVETVRIPASVTEFGEGVFYECENLRSVEFPEDSHLKTINKNVFAFTALESICFPESLEKIDQAICLGCENLREVRFAGKALNLVFLGAYSFQGTSLTEFELMTDSAVEIEGSFLDEDIPVLCAYGAPIIEQLEKLGIPYQCIGGKLQADIKDESGNALVSGYTVNWFRSGQEESIGVGNRIFMSEGEQPQDYSFEIVLGEELREKYYGTERVTFSEDQTVATVTLEPIPQITVEGKVVNAAGAPVADASAVISVIFDDGYAREEELALSEDGSFRTELPDVTLSLTLSRERYYTRKSVLSAGRSGLETLQAGNIILYALPASRVDLAVYSMAAVKESESDSAAKSPVFSLEGYDFALLDSEGNSVPGVVREGFALYLGENAAGYAGQQLTLRSTCLDGSMTAADVTVSLDKDSVGAAAVVFRERGKLLAENIEGELPARVFVYGEEGTAEESDVVSGTWQSRALPDGNYRIVLMQDQDYIRDVQTLSLLDELGLAEGSDYVSVSAAVKEGVVTELSGIEVPAFDTDRFDCINQENTYVKLNKSVLPVGSLVSLRIGYEIKEEYAGILKNLKLVIPLPENVEYIGQSATVDGALAEVSYEDHCLRVSVGAEEEEAVFRCLLMPQKDGDYTLSAYLSFERELSDTLMSGMQPVGETNLRATQVSLTVPEQTGRTKISVTGTALADSLVTVYDGDTACGTATAKASGFWQCEIELCKPYQHSDHYICAMVNNSYGYSYYTETKRVVYDVRYADVKNVVMKNFGHGEVTTVWDFQTDRDKEKVESYDFNPNYPTFTFQVFFDTEDPAALGEAVPEVYVKTTGANGATALIRAAYDEASGSWIGSGDLNFDTIPVSLSVSFDQPQIDIPLDFEQMSDNNAAFGEILAEMGISLEDYYDTEVIEDSESAYRLRCVPKDPELGLPLLYLDMEVTDLSEEESAGLVYMHDADGNSMGVSVSRGENSVSWIMTLDNGKAFRTSLRSEAAGSPEAGIATVAFLDSKAGQFLKNVFDIGLSTLTFGLSDQVKLVKDIRDKYKLLDTQYAEYRRESDNVYTIYLPHKRKSGKLSLEPADHRMFTGLIGIMDNTYANRISVLQEQISLYNKAAAIANGISGLIPAMKVAKGAKCLKAVYMNSDLYLNWSSSSSFGKNMLDNATNFLSLGMSAYENWLDSQISGFHEKMMDDLYQLERDIVAHYREDEEPPELPEPPKDTEQTSPENKISKPDPSGYVYEAVPSNRLEGVTASIYQKIQKTDASGEEIGDPEWVLWDAENYDEIQNQITGVDGTYGWDVPFGTWKVRFEKDGYDTVESNEMVVPPEWTDVNIGMVSKAAPEVKYLNVYEERIEIALTQYVLPETMESGIVVTADGTTLSGTIEPLNLEENYDKTASYASRYQFVPDMPLAPDTAVTVELSGVKSYNEKTIEQYSENLPVKKEIREILATDIPVIGYQEEGILTFSLTDAGAGKAVQITNLMTSILEFSGADEDGVRTVTADATGTLTVPVKGLMPGTGVLRLEMPEYGLELEQKITVCRHSWQDAVTEPTCTEQGFTTHTCTSCGEIRMDNYTAARGHSWDAGKPDGTGKKVYHCTVCNETKTEKMPEEQTDIASCTTALAGNCVYNGKEQKPAVTVSKGGKTLVEGQDYTVSYRDNVNAGTAKAIVTGTGNYRGTVTRTFTIAKAVNSMTASNITKTYKKKKQSVSVVPGQTGGARLSYKSSNKKVKVTTSGKVTIPAKFIGKVTITVTASETGNFLKTEKKITITVNPSGTKLSKVKNVSGKKAEVKWKKTTDVTGYQIQYATDKNFRKGAKIVTVKGKSKTSGTIKKLKKKKTYYVRVRTYKTVSGVKYYSAWSKAQKVKIIK